MNFQGKGGPTHLFKQIDVENVKKLIIFCHQFGPELLKKC